MTPAEDCRSQLESLNQKIKEAKERLKITTDKNEIEKLKNRIRGCNQAANSIREQLKFFDKNYISQRRISQSQMRKKINTQTLVGDFFSRSKEVWSDIEGKTWQQIEDAQRENDITAYGVSKKELQQILVEGCSKLTKRQTIYINEYFNNGLSMEAIACDYGVTRSTVSRCIKAGLIRIQDWVDARLSVQDFEDKNNKFDWKSYLEQNNKIVTDRQRELLLLILTGQAKTQVEIAKKLNLHQSTVVRTLATTSRTVEKLQLKNKTPKPIRIEDWERADVFSIALQLDMPLNFYYKYCFDRKKRYKGLTRYIFEITKRVRAGKNAKQISDEFGISEKTARGLISLVKRNNYIQRINEFSENSSILELLSDDIYVRLQHYVTKYKK